MADTKPQLKLLNRVNIVGDVIDIDVNKRLDDNGELEALMGNITAQTGDDETKTMRLGFYQSPKFRSGSTNPNFARYQSWADDFENGVDLRNTKFKMSSAIDANVFVGTDGNLVETTQIGAGFFDRNTPSPSTPNMAEFSVEAILKPGCVQPEIRDEIETGRSILHVELADFRGQVYPARFVIENADGIAHISSLADSAELSILNVWGRVESSSEVIREEVPAAFGDPRIIETVRSRRENIITGAAIEAREVTEEVKAAILEGRQAFEVHKTTVAEKNGAKKSAPQASSKPQAGAQPKSDYLF